MLRHAVFHRFVAGVFHHLLPLVSFSYYKVYMNPRVPAQVIASAARGRHLKHGEPILCRT